MDVLSDKALSIVEQAEGVSDESTDEMQEMRSP
jgi:hypothetical protein